MAFTLPSEADETVPEVPVAVREVAAAIRPVLAQATETSDPTYRAGRGLDAVTRRVGEPARPIDPLVIGKGASAVGPLVVGRRVACVVVIVLALHHGGASVAAGWTTFRPRPAAKNKRSRWTTIAAAKVMTPRACS